MFVGIYVGNYILSLLLYFFFNIEKLLIRNKEGRQYKLKMEFYKILGFIIYYEKYPINNEENERKEKKKEISDQENKIQNDIHDTENTNNPTNKNNIDQNMNFAGKQTDSNTKTENTRNTKEKKNIWRYMLSSNISLL